MENEAKKKYLKQYIPIRQAAREIEMEIDKIYQDAMFPGIGIGVGAPHGHNHTDLSDFMAKLEEARNRLVNVRYEKVKLYMEIFNHVEEMENEMEKRILRLKYLNGLSWDEICKETSYSWRQVHRIHASALNHFEMA